MSSRILVRMAAIAMGFLPGIALAQASQSAPRDTLPLDASTMASTAANASTRLTLNASRLRIVVSIADRTLFALDGGDTRYEASIGVAMGRTLEYAGQRWTFRMPRGERRVLRKLIDPVWTPPDWHYAETARNHGLKLARLDSRGVTLNDGARLVVRDGVVGIVFPDDGFAELPTDEHIVFGGRLFIPPLGTLNRRVVGDLGSFALDLGDGYLIHGTRNAESVGAASTHGCIRMLDADLRWLFENVTVGVPVLIR
jgi:lipoprotein-anchoring transpeptidase ErfK/SrfK